MRVTVLLFAGLRQAVGASELGLELPNGATVREAADRLAAQHRGLELRGVMTAVNERFATPDAALVDGDVLALLPPVSGG